MPCHSIYTTDLEFSPLINSKIDSYAIDTRTLHKISAFKSPNTALALFYIPKLSKTTHEGPIVVLEDIRDPGNLGTIIRTCDWFGVTTILCSKNSVDCYNAKVIQSTMGSIARVSIEYIELEEMLPILKKESPIYLADLEGENVFATVLNKQSVLVFGNEAKGLSSALKNKNYQKITIPKKGGAESLNLSSSVAILLSQISG